MEFLKCPPPIFYSILYPLPSILSFPVSMEAGSRVVVQDRLCAFVEGEDSCLAPLPTIELDPHIWCIKCRGLRCLPSSPCSTCVIWGEDQWTVYFNAHKKWHTVRVVQKERKILQSSSSKSKRRPTATSEDTSYAISHPPKRSRKEGCTTTTSSTSQVKSSCTPSDRTDGLVGHAPLAPSGSQSCASSFSDAVASGSPSTHPGTSPPRKKKDPGSKKNCSIASAVSQGSPDQCKVR